MKKYKRYGFRWLWVVVEESERFGGYWVFFGPRRWWYIGYIADPKARDRRKFAIHIQPIASIDLGGSSYLDVRSLGLRLIISKFP